MLEEAPLPESEHKLSPVRARELVGMLYAHEQQGRGHRFAQFLHKKYIRSSESNTPEGLIPVMRSALQTVLANINGPQEERFVPSEFTSEKIGRISALTDPELTSIIQQVAKFQTRTEASPLLGKNRELLLRNREIPTSSFRDGDTPEQRAALTAVAETQFNLDYAHSVSERDYNNLGLTSESDRLPFNKDFAKFNLAEAMKKWERLNTSKVPQQPST